MSDQQDLVPELLAYAAGEDLAAAVEAERRRLAHLLQASVVDPLNLLLAQANAYEQTLSGQPTSRMAISVLSALARQALQQVRDLESSLRPTALDELGLGPALESLASRVMRASGLQISLSVERLRERPPANIELALFRAAQDALERAVRQAHAQQASVSLARSGTRLVLRLADDGSTEAGVEMLRAACQHIVQLGGVVETGTGPQGGLYLSFSLPFASPPELTTRELDVLRLLAEGRSNKAIASALGVSPRTVNFHLDNIYSKLGVASRTEAAIYALRQGWTRPSAT
ncbi:MAG TPA: LuxR C-terminal-related transcriptional regulator [Roseiflexaceae bacterium]|nr:LuxR C-terminal-related transcriptional regulator [Roseiflexaceae bacterium]